MKFNTAYFGQIDINEKNIINFEDGILGFEDLKRFVVIKDDQLTIDYLQCIDEDITFSVINPFLVTDEYEFKISSNIIDKLSIKSEEDVLVYTVVVIPEDITKIRTNLQGPIVINMENNKGKQILLSDKYPLRYEIYEKVGV